MNIKRIFKFTVGLMILATTIAKSNAVETIQLLYFSRPPYIYMENNHLLGLTGKISVDAFTNAKIAYELRELKPELHMVYIQKNEDPICTIGWFKTEERAKFSKFTDSIYKDEKTAILTKKVHPDLNKDIMLKELLSNQKLTLIAKESYSYGNVIDSALKKYQPKTFYTKGIDSIIGNLVLFGRGDYMFIAPEEFRYNAPSLKDMTLIKLLDAPEGNDRYLVCSQKVLNETLEKLNAEIKKLRK